MIYENVRSRRDLPARRLLTVVLTCALVLPVFMSGCQSSETPLLAFLRRHIQKYPALEIDDLYKLCHQSSLGPRHALEDTTTAFEHLVKELSEVEADSARALYESISVSGGMVRVDLCAYKARGASVERLFDAMLLTAEGAGMNQEVFEFVWKEVMGYIKSGKLPFDYDQALAFTEKMKAAGFPAVHHSRRYVEEYKPAYRVVRRSIMESLLDG